MPKIDFKLASERLRIAGGSDPVRGTSFNAQNFRVSTPRINADAANIRFTPVQPPEIVVDQTLNAIANTANVFTQAAFKFQEAEAQAKADQKILQYDLAVDQLRNKYKGLIGQAAVEGYSAYEQSVKQLTQQVIGSENDYVKAKMIPALAQIQNKSLLDGASHKATELRTWQGNILESQQLNTRNKILEVSGNADGIQQVGQIVKEQLTGFDSSPLFQGRPDALKVVKQKFLDEFAKDVIDYHTKIGNFERAMDYIQWAGDNNVSPEVIGTEYAQLNTAIDKLETDRRTKENLRRTEQKYFIEKAFDNALLASINQGNREPLEQIKALDPSEYVKYIGHYANAIQEIPLTVDQEQELRELIISPYIMQNPEILIPYGKRGLEEYKRIIGLQGIEYTRVRRQATNFLDSIFPGSGYESFRDPKANAAYNNFISTLEADLRNPDNKGMTYDDIMYRWQNNIINNKQYNEETTGWNITRALLNPVSSGDLLVLESAFETNTMSKGMLDEAYLEAKYHLASKYGITGMTKEQAFIELRKNGNIRSFYSDAINLGMQYKYFRQKPQSFTNVSAEYDKSWAQNPLTPPDKQENDD